MELGNRFLARYIRCYQAEYCPRACNKRMMPHRHIEKEDLNQYWYSSGTIKVLVQVERPSSSLSTESYQNSNITADE